MGLIGAEKAGGAGDLPQRRVVVEIGEVRGDIGELGIAQDLAHGPVPSPGFGDIRSAEAV
jgi:hypothetical protein